MPAHSAQRASGRSTQRCIIRVLPEGDSDALGRDIDRVFCSPPAREPVTKEETAGLDYGPKPTRWKEEITSYLAVRLNDPKNADHRVPHRAAQMYQRKVAFRDMHYGWATCVWVNDKNSAGAFPASTR